MQLQAYFAQENYDYAVICTHFGGRNIGRSPSKPPIRQINFPLNFPAIPTETSTVLNESHFITFLLYVAEGDLWIKNILNPIEGDTLLQAH